MRELFERLNDTLTASFDLMYSHAVDYFRENGNLEIPRRYKTPDGYSLGQWIFTQRRIYNGEQYGNLNDELIKKLEEIGMVWSSRQVAWDIGFVHAEEYLKQLNGQSWKTNYVSPDGYNTGAWLRSQVRAKQKGNLSPENEKLLKNIGIRFEKEPAKKNDIKVGFSQTITQGLTP